MDLIGWLLNQSHPLKTYCAGRDDRFRIAGVGSAYTITSKAGDLDALFSQLDPILQGSDERVRFYGGIKFDFNTAISGPWQPFGRYHFTVPRFEFVRRAEETFFAVNIIRNPDGGMEDPDDIQAQLEQIDWSGPLPEADLPRYIEAVRNPDKDAWVRHVERALDLIGNGTLQKIVLSGQLDLRFQEPINPGLLFRKLIGQNSNSFHFYFQTGATNAFMGITPERLYRREGRNIKTEAIAGTRPRGTDDESDAALARELQTTDKDLREHRWVSDILRNGLEPLCKDVEIPDRERIIKLRHVQHLQTLFSGHLKDNINDSDILSRLHPTPAVGGHPGDTAVKYISEIENYDRGWYAGPVGWIGRDVTGFAVGIRSGLVNGKSLTLYAGSGIVEGSDPLREWDENQTKLLNFTKLFQ